MTEEQNRLLWSRINDLEDGIERALEVATLFIAGRGEDTDPSPGEQEMMEALAELGELIGFGEEVEE